MKLDKRFLLCYTDTGADGLRHSYSAWFCSEEELRRFIGKKKKKGFFQDDFAIEIKNYRLIQL